MDFFPDLTKPLSEKDAFDLATEAWLYDEMTNDELDPDAALLAELDDDLFPDAPEGDLADALFGDGLDDDMFRDEFDDSFGLDDFADEEY